MPPPDPSPLSPLPSPSHRPGEGDVVEAVEAVGCAVRTFNVVHGAHSVPYVQIATSAFPSPGWGECGGRGARGEGPGGQGVRP